MKNIVRAFVVVLALTGTAATTRTDAPATAKTIVAPLQTNMAPTPVCDPNDSRACDFK
jgi:hypothetical protein